MTTGWAHGVPALRPAGRPRRRPSRGGRRYPSIFLAEDRWRAGDLVLHFACWRRRPRAVRLRMADYLNLRAVVTDPEFPVTERQVHAWLSAAADSGTWDGEDLAAAERVVKMLDGQPWQR